MNNADNCVISKITSSENKHVFYFWENLTDEEKKILIDDLRDIDMKKVGLFYNQFIKATTKKLSLKPAKCFSIFERNDNLKIVGENAIRNKEVAILTVAGGQASRLGYDSPKGCFPISPLKNKSLFQIFAEKILFYSQRYSQRIDWYIMTSDTNDKDTKDFFEKNNYFGLDKSSLHFFKQGMLPTLTIDGRLILKDRNRIFLNPDGHGGVLSALTKNGFIDDMKNKNIKYLSYFQVDNPLVNLLDPYFIGYHILSRSDVSTKVIKKLYPEEKLGSIVRNTKHNFVIEYSDLPKENMFEKDDNGELKYLMGSIGIHVFSVDFLEKFSKKLPIHFAKKEVEGYDFSKDSSPELKKIQAIKFETFIFDIIRLTKDSVFFETEREEDFSPLKNKSGADSIDTTIAGQIKQFFNWLKFCGLIDESINADDRKIEISPLYAPDKYIFLEKYLKESDKLKKIIFNENGFLNEKIYIS